MPVGSGTAFYGGGLASAFTDQMSPEDRDHYFQLVEGHVQEKQSDGITPDNPLGMAVPSPLSRYFANQPQTIILATAFPGPSAANAIIAARHIIRLANEMSIAHLTFPLLGSGSGGLDSLEAFEAIYDGINSELQLLVDTSLRKITITTLNPRVLQHAPQYVLERPTIASPFSNDLAQGEDLLGIAGEVTALAQTLLLRNVQPPIAVGILGGWGSGKSFVMHLMRQEMMRIRARNGRGGLWRAGDIALHRSRLFDRV